MTAKPISPPPNAKALLVDSLGRMKAKVAELSIEEKKLRDMLVALYSFGEHDGELFRAVVIQQTQERLISEKVREMLSKAQLKKCTQAVEMTVVRVNARVQALANR